MSSFDEPSRYRLAWYVALTEQALAADAEKWEAPREEVERILSVAREIVHTGEPATLKEIESELIAATGTFFPELMVSQSDLEERAQELLIPQPDEPSGMVPSASAHKLEKKVQIPPAPSQAEKAADPISAEVIQTLRTLGRKVDQLERELAEVRRELRRSSQWPSKFRKLQERVKRAERAGAETGPPAWHRLGSENLRAQLRERGFYISEDVCRSLWAGFLGKQIVVLEGVPGTGKSVLAKLLPEVLLAPHPKRGTSYSEMSVHPDLSVDEFIGGRTLTHGNRVGPSAGPLLESVLCCHESPDGYWLLMDEFNRCSADVIFAPLLDALTGTAGIVRHPYMFPDRDTEEACVPIPPGFRILGTMNPLDRGLFEISQALRQRIQFVRIPTLRGAEERAMIRESVLASWLGDSTNGDRSRWERVATDASRQLHEVAEQVRELATRQPASQFAACELGSRLVMAAVKGWLVRLEENASAVTANPKAAIDAQIRNEYLRQLEACGTDALQVLLDEIFPSSRFPSAHAGLGELLEMRRVF